MAVVPGWIGLAQAVEEYAELPAAERDATPALISPAKVVRVVTDLLARSS